MPTNWKTPTGSDLPKVINMAVMQKSNENIDPSSLLASQQNANSSLPISFDPDLENRANEQVKLVIAQVREAIQVAGRYPISVTEDSVPPRAELQVLNIAAFQLISSTPNLQMVIMTDKGVYSPLQKLYQEGLNYIKKLEAGAAFMLPSDPTGIDYTNAVSDSNPPIRSIISAPINGEPDISTDGAPSGKTTEGTVVPNANISGTVGDVYIQRDADTEVVIRIWEKTSQPGTSYGWT